MGRLFLFINPIASESHFNHCLFCCRYWVLPHCGGVFVEGLESGELTENLREEQVLLGTEVSTIKAKSKKEVKEEKNAMKKEGQNCDVKGENKDVKIEPKEENKMNGNVEKEERMEVDQNKCVNEATKDITWNCANNNATDVDDLKKVQNAVSTTNSGKHNATSDESSSLTTTNKMENAISLLKQEEISKVKNAIRNTSSPLLDRASGKSEEMNGTIAGGESERLKYAKETIANTSEKKDSEMLYNSKSESLPLVNGNPEYSAFKVPDGSSPALHSKFDGSYSELFNNLPKHEGSHNKTLNNLSPIVNNALNNSLKSPSKSEQQKESSFRSIDSMLGADSGKGLPSIHYGSVTLTGTNAENIKE